MFSLRDPLTEKFGQAWFQSLPLDPGVYFFYSAEGLLLYIGQSACLRKRIGSYRHVTPEKNPRRTLRLVSRIARVEWQTCGTPGDAVLLERELLFKHRPPFNRAGTWRGDPWWLNVEAAEGKLHIDFRREPSGIGPLPSAFRHVLASLVRCLYRRAFPTVPLSEFPHGILSPVLPTPFQIFVGEPLALSSSITSFVGGQGGEWLASWADLPEALSLSEREFWEEEIERLARHMAKGAVRMEEMMTGTGSIRRVIHPLLF